MSRKALEQELSRRARFLAKQAGASNRACDGWNLVLPELSIAVSAPNATLIVERSDGRMLYMESPNGTVIRTCGEDELQFAVGALRKHMVLEDLADV